MDLTPIMILILCRTAVTVKGAEEQANDTKPAETTPEGEGEGKDFEIELIHGFPSEDIDVLCSNHSETPGEPSWSWLDVQEENVMGHWREYGICIDKYGISRFRFRAFHLDQPGTYGRIKARCKEYGYDYVQPARTDPLAGSDSIGWPDRGFIGVHGPVGYQLGAGRADSTWSRLNELANDGWYLFRTEDGSFAPGFISVEPCNRLQVVKDSFDLYEIPCDNYVRCVKKGAAEEE